MPKTRRSLLTWCHRAWRRWQGEKILLTTFWPNDYRRGALVKIDGRCYRVTRYFHADDPRFFEVWGKALPPSEQ